MIRTPNFTQTIWLRIENKIGRKLSEEENKWLYYTSGMYKEWFFNSLDNWTIEEVEWWITNRQHPMFTSGPSKSKQKREKRSLFQTVTSFILEFVHGRGKEIN